MLAEDLTGTAGSGVFLHTKFQNFPVGATRTQWRPGGMGDPFRTLPTTLLQCCHPVP